MKKIVFGLILGLVSFNSFGAAVCLNTSTGQIVTKPRCKGVFQNLNFSPIAGPQGIPGPAGPQGIPGPAGESGKVLASACKAEDIVGKWGFISSFESGSELDVCVMNNTGNGAVGASCAFVNFQGSGTVNFSGTFSVDPSCGVAIKLNSENGVPVIGAGFISPDRNSISAGLAISVPGGVAVQNFSAVRIP